MTEPPFTVDPTNSRNPVLASVASVALDPSQLAILRMCEAEFGPLIAAGEVVLGPKHNPDIRVLQRYGLLGNGRQRGTVGMVYRITAKARRLLKEGQVNA